MKNSSILKQLPGYYQSVVPYHATEFKHNFIYDIDYLVGILLTVDPVMDFTDGYLIISSDVEDYDKEINENDVYNNTWAKLTFSKEPQFFPTSPLDQYGAIVEYKGKTFYISFDEDDCLTIGVNGILYRFDGNSTYEDCLDIYQMIFEGVIPDEIISM